MPKVSIIIPVYNNDKFITECLDSIMNQTLQDIEIICVDDGSTDNSYQLLLEYQKRDSRIQVIHMENKGVVAARNKGIDVANGKYVGFVDSDDWIDADMYESLYMLAENNCADLVTSGYYLEGNYTTTHIDNVDEGLYSTDCQLEYLREHTIYNLSVKETGIRATLCSKLFRKDSLKKIQCIIPDDVKMSEDKLYVISYILECKSVYVSKRIFYHYRINQSSAVNAGDMNYLNKVNAFYNAVAKLYNHRNFTEEMRKQIEIYVIEMLVHGINRRMGFRYSQILWIDPYWVDKLPINSRIVLYGAGELGAKYKRQLLSRKNLYYVGCIDFNYERFVESEYKVNAPEELLKWDFDYVVITIKNSKKAEEVRAQLKDFVDEDKILWFEQKEIFWKYAEADGLLLNE